MSTVLVSGVSLCDPGRLFEVVNAPDLLIGSITTRGGSGDGVGGGVVQKNDIFVAGVVSVCSASVLCTRPCFCVLFLCAFWSYHWYDTDPSFGLSCGVQMYAGFCRVTLKCSGDEFKRPCSFRILRQCVHQFDFGRVLHLVNVFFS